MKRITNILSYLWLLLLLFAACSDWEEITIALQREEEVELTISTSIPNLGGSTRTAPEENITSITALAFDSDHELIKVITKGVIQSTTTNTTGTLTITVPVRTRRIHFIAKNDDEYTEITNADYGRTDEDLLKLLTSNELHYWQVMDFSDKDELLSFKNSTTLTLIRNMAKVYLTLPSELTGHLVGFLNYNTSGTIAAYKNGEFKYQPEGVNHEMPTNFIVTSDSEKNLGTEHYLFEEKNVKGDIGFGEASDLVYAICWIKKTSETDDKGKYYKIAFKSGGGYYHIIRNLAYEIKISKDLDTTRGYASFADAVAKAPINDADAKVQIHMTFNPDPLSLLLGGDAGTTTITNFDGIQTLQIGYPEEFFGEGGVIINGYDPQPDVTEATTSAGTKIWVVEYNVEGKTELELSVTLKDGIENAVKDMQIQFMGEGEDVFVDNILHANALQRGDLTVTTNKNEIPKTTGSQFTATVTIPYYTENVGNYRLLLGDANDAFTIIPPEGAHLLDDGSYDVTSNAGSQAVFTFTLKEEAATEEALDEHTISFDLYTDFHHLIGSTTVTLVEEEIVKEITATPSATTLNYANSSVEDLWVNVTVPKEVTTLTFASEHFTVMVAGSEGEYVPTDGEYSIAHAENATGTIVPFRIRLKDDVSVQSASFTFSGTSADENVTVQPDTENIQLNSDESANVRWQGNVPLDSDDYTTIVPLKYEWFESITAGSQLFLEFNVTGGDTSWLEVFEIRGDTESDWNNPVLGFTELTNGRYTATENGNVSLSLTITADVLSTIADNFRSNFLGETDIAMAIRGAGITLTKVSVVEQAALPVYELWFENNNTWNGSQDYATFFTRMGDLTTNNDNQGNMNDTFYDPSFTVNEVTYSGADAKRTNAMVMGENNSISFTISDTRYLTLLVARNGNAPSINLQKNGQAWTATSDKTQVPATYNFSKDGDITTSGRLIRYTLPAGTYTLQRGNNEYLLYYMRVTKDKPTMTDIVQPTVSDYALSWSGGEWGNWTYVENGNLYVVDDDAKTFTLTYTGLGLTEGTLSLSNSSLTIPRNNENQDTYTINGNSAEITNTNVGTYTYTIGSGEISNPAYKYSNFYDKIALKAVNGNGSATVKNSVKLMLVQDAITYEDHSNAVEYYTNSMEKPALAICTPATRIQLDRDFEFSIVEDWNYSGNSKTLNNGVALISQNGHTFKIAQGQETSDDQTWTHPFWYTYIYYLDWGSFDDTSNANRSLSTMTISTEDTDIWFSYKNKVISKSMVINVNQNPGEVVSKELNLPLNISLDFYRKYSNETTDENYDNLIYGVSRVGLKATITIPNGQNAVDYYDKIVYLQGAFSNTSGTGNAGIHWDNSRDSGNDFEIAYRTDVNHDGTQLQFKIEEGKTEYNIEWVFKGGSQYNSSNNNGNVGFTYTISALNGNHQISGQNSAALTIKRSADIFNGSIEFDDWNSTTFDEIFPIGTNISLTYSNGGIAKFLNGYWQMLHIPEFKNDYESDSNFYIRVGTDPIAFDVSEQIKLYNNETNVYENNLSSSLVALRIQGNEGSILRRVTVTAPPSAFPNNNPNYVP